MAGDARAARVMTGRYARSGVLAEAPAPPEDPPLGMPRMAPEPEVLVLRGTPGLPPGPGQLQRLGSASHAGPSSDRNTADLCGGGV